MINDVVRMLYNITDLSCSCGSSIMSLPNNANSGQARARWIFWITRGLQRELRLTKRCKQRCHILVCHSTAFIHTLQCLLCYYLTPRLRQCAVVCGKKSTRHLWMIKLPGTNNDAVFVRTLSRKLFSACANSHKRYNDAIMGAMASQITSLTIVYSNIFRRRSRKRQCSASLPFVRVTGEFPAEMASNAKNVSIWWRHHEMLHDCPRQWSNHKLWGANRMHIPRAILQPHNETKHNKSVSI